MRNGATSKAIAAPCAGAGRMIASAVLAMAMALALAVQVGAARAQTAADPATHRYVEADAPPSAAAAALADRLGGAAAVFDLVAAGEQRPLARAEAARLADGSLRLLAWQSLTPLPVLRRDIRAAEDLALAEALDRHLPEGALVLSLPGASHRLAALTGAAFPLAAEPEPLAMPGPWTGLEADVLAVESGQWGAAVAGADAASQGRTRDLIDALLAEDRIGAAQMKVLAGPGDAYLLLHLEDAFQLGFLRPDRMAMSRAVLASASFSHDLAQEVRRWSQANGQAAWAVDRAPDGRLRGNYLAEPTETATLVAQLLPFNTSRLDSVPGLRLVWQHEGYWLYRIDRIGD